MEEKKKIKIAYCGAPGSFAEQAAIAVFPQESLTPCPSFRDAYERTDRGETDRTLLPLENSYAGEVGPTMDLILHSDLSVTDVYEMRVVQNLVAAKAFMKMFSNSSDHRWIKSYRSMGLRRRSQ